MIVFIGTSKLGNFSKGQLRLGLSANFAPMSQGQSKKKPQLGLADLADLHKAMGGEVADVLPSDTNALSPSLGRSAELSKGMLYLSRDKKKRRGKVVTLVEGFSQDVDPGDLKSALTADLKSLQKICGSGGSIEDGKLLVQGDHRDRVQTYYEAAGYRIKRKGG